MPMDTLTEMYRSAYFNSLKQKVIDKAKAIIKTNSDLKEEYVELVAACAEFQDALGKEETNAAEWASVMSSFIKNYGSHTDVMMEFLQTLCDTDPSKFTRK